MAVALNHGQNKSHPERISNIKPFFNQYSWKEINFQLYKNDWKKFESNNKTYMCHIYHIIFYTYHTILEK